MVQPLLVFGLPRMTVMAYPVLLLLASRFLITSIGKGFLHKKTQKYVFYSMMFLLTLPNVVWSIEHNKQVLQKDTRLMAKEWIEENIHSGSHILLEGKGSMRGIIRLNENKVSLHRKYLKYSTIIEASPGYHGNALKALEIKMKNIQALSYHLYYFYRPEKAKYLKKFREDYSIGIAKQGVLTIDEYKRMGIDYVIVSRGKPSDNYSSEKDREIYPTFYDFFRSLEREMQTCKGISI